MAFTDTPYHGNIIGSEALVGTLMSAGKITTSGGGVYSFEDRLFHVEGPKWRENRVAYDYLAGVGETRQQVRRVIDYKCYWKITMRAGGRVTFQGLMDLESLMDGTVWGFTAGLRPDMRFFFVPPGDSTSPTVEVVKVSPPLVDTVMLGDKYIGYGSHELTIESVEAFQTKRLPYVPAIITSLLSGRAMRSANIMSVSVF